MALFTAIPPSMMQPMYDCTLKVESVNKSIIMTPMAASGTENITTKGYRSDSYNEAITM